MSAHPVLHQLNTRVYLTERSRELGRPATLDDLPDTLIGELVDSGVGILWLLSVWSIGLASQKVSRSNPEWLREFAHTLPDLDDEDIAGSGFAIRDYSVADGLGGPKALAALRRRLAKRGIRLMLDFVPNHMGLDHPWLESHPEYFVQGNAQQLRDEPQNFFAHGAAGRIFAHGRDPYFPGWPDTVQLDYSNAALQARLQQEILQIASQCDGLRCDMAMLVTPEIFQRTWGTTTADFWTPAIRAVKDAHPDFIFMAEVYWDMESQLHAAGFDYCYDKRLYDRLRDGDHAGVRGHLRADITYQSRLARFLENHDEPRAADTFTHDRHVSAAALTFLSPGLRFFHQGQAEGRRVRISPHLVRGPDEAPDARTNELYSKLLGLLKDPIFHDGEWGLLEISRAWDDNWSSDCLVAWYWRDAAGRVALCIVNLAGHEAQGKIHLPQWLQHLSARSWRNDWSDEGFSMPAEQWHQGAWTLFAQPSQVFVLRCGPPA